MNVLRAIRRRVRSERGTVALPVAAAMLALTLAIGAVAVGHATGALQGSSRDARVKRALQAADAGLRSAIWRTNTLSEAISDPVGLLTCAVKVSGGAIDLVAPQGIGGEQWCPKSGPEELANGASYSYWLSVLADVDLDDLESTLEREIVATGSAGPVTRRVTAHLIALDVRRLFRDYTVFSTEDLNLSNQTDVGSPEIEGNARSNGNINLNHPNAVVFGDATPGPGMSVTGPGDVTGSTAPALDPLTLPPVTAPAGGDIDGLPSGTKCKTPGGLLNLTWVNCPSSIWNSSSRRLTVGSNTVVVLSGNVHEVCSISISNNAKLLFTAPLVNGISKPVRVYFDEPSDCGGSSGMAMTGNPTVKTSQVNLGVNVPLLGDLLALPSLTNPIIQTFAVGDSTFTLENNSATPEVPMTVYAPEGTVATSNYVRVQGGFAARRVTMANNSEIVPASPGLGDLLANLTPIYSVSRYKECGARMPGAGEPPDVGC